MFRMHTSVLYAVLMFLCAPVLADKVKSGPNAAPEARAAVSQELHSGDEVSIEKAEAQIRTWLSVHQGPIDIWRDWMPALESAERFQDVLDLSIPAVTARPDAVFIERVMLHRMKALLELKRPQEALQAAKAAYCLCQADRLAFNANNLQRCLEAANADDPDIGKRFRTEVALAAMSDPDPGAGPMATTQPSETVFQSIKIDDAPFQDGLNYWKQKCSPGSFRDQIQYGNLLIAAGKPEDAEAVFRKAYLTAKTPQDLDAAKASICLALRAEDGNDLRGNAWLAALQNLH
jgi:hypothetical protein